MWNQNSCTWKWKHRLTAPESLTTLTFCGTCRPSTPAFLARCITVLFTPGLSPWGWGWGWAWPWAWPGPAEGAPWMGMILWETWVVWIGALGLLRFCTVLFLLCCCWFCCCWCHCCWFGPGPGVCCCWPAPFAICSRVLTLGRSDGVWGVPLGGKGVPWWGFICDGCGLLGNCLCCCGGGGCDCCGGCDICSCCCCCAGGIWEGAGPWPWFAWALILSNSSFFLTPACICLLSSFRFRISSLSRFCSSILRRYCRVSSSSSGSCHTKHNLTISFPVLCDCNGLLVHHHSLSEPHYLAWDTVVIKVNTPEKYVILLIFSSQWIETCH